MMAAGPAAWEAFRAPKSQPEPMMEPTLAKRSPTTPTWRLSCGSEDWPVGWVSVELVKGWPFVVDSRGAPSCVSALVARHAHS